MLRKINNVNRQATTKKVGHEQFYIPELTDKVDVKRDYFKWLVDAANKVSSESFPTGIFTSDLFLSIFQRNFAYATTHLSLMPKPKLYFWKLTRTYRCILLCKRPQLEELSSAYLLFNSIFYLKSEGIIWWMILSID